MDEAKETGRTGAAVTIGLVYALAALTGALLNHAGDDLRWMGAQDSLFAASAGGDVAAVERALTRGASIQTADAQGLTALSLAARDGRVHVVRRLLGADGSADLAVPLVFAAQNDRVEIVELLLRAGARTDGRVTGSTALWFAATHGNVEVAPLLLDAGAQVDQRGVDGRNSLEIASDNADYKLLALFRANKKPAP